MRHWTGHETPVMNIVRILLIALAAWIIFRLWQNYRLGKPKQGKPAAVQNMVACAICKTHVPQDEALRQGERFYCSREHLESDQ